MNVTIWADHGSDVFGVPDDLHLTKLLTILRWPMPQGSSSFTTIPNPTAFAIVQVEASNMVHGVNAGASAVIKPQKDEAAKARSSA